MGLFSYFSRKKQLGTSGDASVYVTLDGSTVTVNNQTALKLSAIYNGLDIISNDIAVLSKGVFQKTENGRIPVPTHPVDLLIDSRPNNLMTSFGFHKALVMSALFRGNGVAIIERNRLGVPLSLNLVQKPVFIYKHKNELYYQIDKKAYHSSEVIHIPGFSFDGITGKGIIEYAADSLGASYNAQKFSREYYGGKAQGIGVVETDKFIKLEQKKQVESAVSKSLNEARVNTWRVPVLDEGMKFKQLRLTAEEMKFIDTAKFSIEEIARWLNISTIKLKSLSDASYNNVENLGIMHDKDSVLPWVRKIEQEYNVKLFTQIEQQQRLYVKFNMNSVMRANIKDRAEYYKTLVLNGMASRNEIRTWEDLNRVEGLDDMLVPMNYHTLEQVSLNIEKLKKDLKDEK